MTQIIQITIDTIAVIQLQVSCYVFISDSRHYFSLSDDLTDQRSEVKLSQPGRGGLTTRHKLEHGVY